LKKANIDLSKIDTVILAGGLGTRLRETVPDRPKVMAEIKGRPFLTYVLDQLNAADLKKVVVSTGYMAQYLENALGSAYKNLRILYSREEKPLGTGGALRLAKGHLNKEFVLVINGDSYFELDIPSFFETHLVKKAIISIILVAINDNKRFGSVDVDGEGRIINFAEKNGESGSGLISAGIYMMNRSVLEDIPTIIPCSLEYDFFPNRTGYGMYGYECDGRFIDIGTPESFSIAKEFLGQIEESQ